MNSCCLLVVFVVCRRCRLFECVDANDSKRIGFSSRSVVVGSRRSCNRFTMTVKENNTEAELLTVERPFRCAAGGCKCCCYQEATFSSGGQLLGSIKEDCWYCVPSFDVKDHEEKGLYVVHPPTCLGGMCVNCCAEGNPCGKGELGMRLESMRDLPRPCSHTTNQHKQLQAAASNPSACTPMPKRDRPMTKRRTLDRFSRSQNPWPSKSLRTQMPLMSPFPKVPRSIKKPSSSVVPL